LTVDWQYPEQPAPALAGVSYGDGQLYTAFRTQSGEQRLVALDGSSGDVLNEQELVTTVMPVYRNGTLYVDGVSGRNRAVLALSPDDFSERWASSVQLSGTELTVTDDAVYGFALDSGNDVVRSIATADGTQRWETEVTLSGFTTTQPVAVGEDSVFASGDALNALAKSDGTEQWSATADSAFTSPPLVAEGRVYAGTENALVKGYDAASGEEVLSVEAPPSFGIEDPFAYADGRLFGLGSFSVFAIDVGPGDVVWEGTKGVGSTLTIAGDHLLGVKTSGQRIVALNRSDGSIAWRAGPDGGNEGLVGGARAFAVGERVYAGYNGRVIALS
jgi:outer membrane protein assembly factor BamB